MPTYGVCYFKPEVEDRPEPGTNRGEKFKKGYQLLIWRYFAVSCGMGEGRKLEVGSGNGGQDRNEGGQKNVGRNWKSDARRIAFWLIGTWNSNKTIYLYWSRIWVKKSQLKE